MLGAGVSYASKLPNWETLAHRLANAAELDKSFVEQGLRQKLQLPAILSIIRARANSLGREWPDLVREALYGEADFGMNRGVAFDTNAFDGAKQPDERIANHLASRNPTLASVVDLCAYRDGPPWRPRPHIGALLTYNLDALIQVYDRARHGSPRIFRTVERPTKGVWAGKIPLYHVHGLLHSRRAHVRDEAADQIILCEDEYHRRTDDAHHFASATTQWALREFVTVFVGCSMTDDLMRRSLFRSKRELHAACEVEAKEPRPHHFAVLCRKTDPAAQNACESDMQELGVIPLWLGKWADLSERFRKLGEHLDALSLAASRSG